MSKRQTWTETDLLNALYDLILNPEITTDERAIIIKYKNDLENKKNFIVEGTRLKRELTLAAVGLKLSKPMLTFYDELAIQFASSGFSRTTMF